MFVAGLFAILFGFVFASLGYRGLGNVHRRRKRSSAMQDATEKPVGEVTPDDGYVQVVGTARAGDAGTFEAPIAGRDALVAHTKLDLYSEGEGGAGTETRSGSSWNWIEETRRSVPFLVEDDTGAAAVELPEEGGLRLEGDRRVVRWPSGQSAPEAVERFLETTDEMDRRPRDRVRYRQAAIEPGDEVVVTGAATHEPGWDDVDVRLAGGSDPQAVVVSNQDESEAESTLLKDVAGYVLGTLFLVGGTAGVVGGAFLVVTTVV